MTESAPLLGRFPDLADRLREAADDEIVQRIRAAETIGRPIGGIDFVERLERRTGRTLKAGKRGPKTADDN